MFKIIVCAVLLGLIIVPFFNSKLPKWFCDKMGWHLKPESLEFDGCSYVGICPRCGKKVLQDSQGNWFAAINSVGRVIPFREKL